MGIFEKIELPEVKKIIIVASGKGGVGKSTVSVNLAIALARQGQKVALIDADIYGPSIPRMLGLEDSKPEVTMFGDKEVYFPLEKYGVKVMSIGFFVAKSQSLIWRGPMAANAITQLFENTQWGEIDYMIVDFPPGTGDIQLTAVQKLNLHGAIIVTTPQEISLNDARKAASMFTNPDLKVPVLGVVENMSWFTPVSHPDEKYYIFGNGGGQVLANEINTKLLGQIPLVAEVGAAADNGLSVFSQNDKSVIDAFDNIVTALL
ncbi:MAG: Mrp/NBP35 family ATP-binding protein [Bacteroidales bacterium]|nr:Mrp/NBP35 family ATP-binding protein [Bacteroidales bacterium]